MGALGGGTCTCAIARAIWCVAAWSPYHSSPHHSTACRTTSSPIAPHHRMSHRIPFLSGSVAPHHSSWSPPQFMVPPTPACISWWGAVICMRWSATTAPAPLPDPFPRACPLPPTPCPGLALHHEFLHGYQHLLGLHTHDGHDVSTCWACTHTMDMMSALDGPAHTHHVHHGTCWACTHTSCASWHLLGLHTHDGCTHTAHTCAIRCILCT